MLSCSSEWWQCLRMFIYSLSPFVENKYNPLFLETINPILMWVWTQAQDVCTFLTSVTTDLWLNNTNNSETLKILMSQLYIPCIHIINLSHLSHLTEWNTLSESLKPPTVHMKSIKRTLNHCQSDYKSYTTSHIWTFHFKAPVILLLSSLRLLLRGSPLCDVHVWRSRAAAAAPPLALVFSMRPEEWKELKLCRTDVPAQL